MQIEITYCSVWKYRPKAASLAEELRKEFEVTAMLISGNGGVFDVTVDGKLIFSKHEALRFPETGEILSQIRKM